jgi:hypothetical protein
MVLIFLFAISLILPRRSGSTFHSLLESYACKPQVIDYESLGAPGDPAGVECWRGIRFRSKVFQDIKHILLLGVGRRWHLAFAIAALAIEAERNFPCAVPVYKHLPFFF